MTIVLLIASLAVAAAQPAPVNPQAAALADFSKQLQAYLALRADLEKELEPLRPTASGTELQARQAALATALRKARAHAKAGDLIPGEVRAHIRREVAADFQRREPAAKKAALEEVPFGPLPAINANYPDRAALPTVPPLLLARLPQLPNNLQYRFFGRHMVILDGDVEIVIDYVRNALPR